MSVATIMLALLLFLWGLTNVSNFAIEESRIVLGLLMIATAIALVVENWRRRRV